MANHYRLVHKWHKTETYDLQWTSNRNLCPTQQWNFEWPWVTLSYLVKFSTTRSVARSFSDSWVCPITKCSVLQNRDTVCGLPSLLLGDIPIVVPNIVAWLGRISESTHFAPALCWTKRVAWSESRRSSWFDMNRCIIKPQLATAHRWCPSVCPFVCLSVYLSPNCK